MKYEVVVDGRTFSVDIDGETVRVGERVATSRIVADTGSPLMRISVDGVSRTYAMTRNADGWQVHRDGRLWNVEVSDERTRSLRQKVGPKKPHSASGSVKAPMPGLVVRLEVEEGQHVTVGTGLLVLEAMKMENEIRSGQDGVVKRILVRSGQAVEKGAVLVEIASGQG